MEESEQARTAKKQEALSPPEETASVPGDNAPGIENTLLPSTGLLPEPPTPLENTPLPSPGLLLRAWLLLSVQSFGGGVATLALIRQTVVEKHRWLSEVEFTRDLALVQAVPGINLLALTILIGKRLAGWRGIVVCMTGLLLPSVTITLLLTAGYAHIKRLPSMEAALHGIVPATVGLGAITTIQMARAPLAASRREGTMSLLVSVFLLAGSALVALRWHGSIVPILCASGGIGAITHWRHEHTRRAASAGEAGPP